MENKFTPGPWEYDKDEDEIHAIDYQETGGDPAHICAMLGSDKRKLSNANLISAAPDLYKALDKAYLDILNIINEGEFKEGIEWNSGYIEDALKKARGEK
jgi:hypothetical protein